RPERREFPDEFKLQVLARHLWSQPQRNRQALAGLNRDNRVRRRPNKKGSEFGGSRDLGVRDAFYKRGNGFDRSRHAELKRASIGIVCLEFVAPIERPAHVPSVNLYPDYSSLTRLDDFVVVKVFCFASRRGGLHEKARSDELIAIPGSEKRNLCGSL